MTKRILIADDHYITRLGLEVMLKELFSFAVIDHAKDGDEVHQLALKNDYDLAILDVNMPGADGVSLVEFLRQRKPNMFIVIHTMSPEELFALRFYRAGVAGYISKESDPHLIKAALRTVTEGKKYFSKHILNLIANSYLGMAKENPFANLSNREFEIAMQLTKGYTLTEISGNLNLQKTTICTYKKRVFEKLGIKTVIELLELSRMYNNHSQSSLSTT